MRPAAQVKSINVLRDFRRSLAEFAVLAIAAIDEAQADVQRTLWWVQNDQFSHWKNQKKKRTAKLAQAKSELFRAEVASPDQRVPATTERKAAEHAERALEEADTKIANVKRWGRALDREILLYKGQCQQLARAVEGDIPVSLARLDRMVASLEKYLHLAVPTEDRPDPSGGAETAEEEEEEEEGDNP